MSEFVTESNGRVTLICATPATLAAEDDGGAALAAVIGYPVAAEWPPEHNDENTRAWSRRILADNPRDPCYGAWYVMAEHMIVGTAGYKGPPSPAGEVEIGYAVVASAQQLGYGTVAAALLVARAFRDVRVTAVLAETLPSLPASQKVLLANGFHQDGVYSDPDVGTVWQYRRLKDPA